MINLESKCLRRVTIEIAIAAANTSGRGTSDYDNLPESYDPIKAAESSGFMAVCLAAARKCIEIVESES